MSFIRCMGMLYEGHMHTLAARQSAPLDRFLPSGIGALQSPPGYIPQHLIIARWSVVPLPGHAGATCPILEALTRMARVLVLATVAALLLVFPAIVMGQPVPDHISRVLVTIDGERVPDDTVVTAIIDGEEVATAITLNGVPLLRIPGTGATTGKEIHFMVGDVFADEVDTWEQGGHQDKKFEISLTTYVPPPPLPPHISRLLVSIDGLPAPDGTVVTAWMDGAVVATALTVNGAAFIRI